MPHILDEIPVLCISFCSPGAYLMAVYLTALKSCTWRPKGNAAEILSGVRHLNQGIAINGSSVEVVSSRMG